MNNVMIHATALCESQNVGEGTRIWAFVHVLPQARIGADCNLCDHVFIENDVTIGDRATIKSGVQLWDGMRVEDDVFIGPNATFTNDRSPRSKHYLAEYPITTIRRGASVGANATLLPGITIGVDALVGAGAVVTRSVPPHAIVVGNPARIMGYRDTHSPLADEMSAPSRGGQLPRPSSVGDVRWLRTPLVEDLRGHLTIGEVGAQLPFAPRRYFVVFNVPSSRIRGEHAHRVCQQLLVCVHGSVKVLVDDGHRREEYRLDSADKALFVPPMVWAAQFGYSADAALVVLASHEYDPDDYIRDYDDFLSLVGNSP